MLSKKGFKSSLRRVTIKRVDQTQEQVKKVLTDIDQRLILMVRG